MTTTAFTDIAWLTTHDPAHVLPPGVDAAASGVGRHGDEVGRGLADAWLVVDSGRVVSVGTGSTPPTDRRVSLGGRAVLPGFVDSHTHMVFAGDRSAEFTARMAGQPYAAGGIATTIGATRSATDEELRVALAGRVAEARAAGITTLEVKSGYAATPDGEARLLRLAQEVTPHTTYLGAHVVPPEHASDPAGYVSLVTGEMLDVCAPLAGSVDVFCEEGAFDADQSREVLAAGMAAGLAGRVHANQLGEGPGVRLAVELGCASADHCTYLAGEDVEALAGASTVATLLPATDFSTRQSYPDGRRLVDAGATVALATNCNPGSSYTTSMSFVIALAVRDCHLTLPEAVWSATAGGGRSLGVDDVGHLRVGARADLVVLDAPSPDHLAYRPGVPLIAATVVGGDVVAGDVGSGPLG
ncbi:imidazolonepropionase [Euzebya pacifica]|uniref:imidazolonepropionase n=1 Tax=Euzebya pacifica TaxID=1608957 RepID=UPI0030F8209C